MTLQTNIPAELVESLAPLLPRLDALGVQELDIFSYQRPGEPLYWLAVLRTSQGRESLGTPELRHLRLREQLPDLLRQLETWVPGPPAAERWLGGK